MKRPLKVLFATYPMAFHTPGGGEVQLEAYAKYLSKYDVEVDFFNPWDPHFLDYDLVHFFSCIGGSYHFCNFIKQLGLPLVITSSLWITEETKYQYPIDEIRTQLSLADAIITNSNTESEVLSQILNLPRETFFTIYNGIDNFFLEQGDAYFFKELISSEKKIILNVGNIEPRKNQLSLVKAISKFPEFQLVIIGHARDKEYTHQCLKEGDENVIYLGPMPYLSETVRSAMKACDIFAIPSLLETPSLAALEAATQGAQIVITEEGSTYEYFGDNAIYINPHSIESIQEAIYLASKNEKNDNLKEKIIQNFKWENVVENLAEVYNNVISKRNHK